MAAIYNTICIEFLLLYSLVPDSINKTTKISHELSTFLCVCICIVYTQYMMTGHFDRHSIDSTDILRSFDGVAETARKKINLFLRSHYRKGIRRVESLKPSCSVEQGDLFQQR